MKKSLILSLLFVWILSPAALGENRTKPSQDHISTPHVTSIAEDADGYIWIGTQRGLNRYNGTSYRVYSQGPEELQDDYINAVCCDTDGRIWIGSSSGIDLLQDGVVQPDKHLRTGRVGNLVSLDEGHLLFSNREGLHILDKGTLETHSVYLDQKLAYNTFSVFSDRYIWIQNTASGDITILDRDWRVIRTIPQKDQVLGQFCEASDGTIYVVTVTGLQRFSPDGVRMPLPPYLAKTTDGKAVLFMVRREGDTFLGIKNEGIYRIGNDEIRREWEDERLAGVEECDVLLTRDNLWLSKDGGELTNLYRQNNEHSIPLPDRYQPDALNMFYPIGGGNILVITNRGVFRQHLSTGQYMPLLGRGLEGMDKLGITLLDKRGNLWILHNYNSLRKYAFDGDTMSLVQEWPVETSNCIWDDAAGNVYLLQGHSILRFTPEGEKTEIQVLSHPDFWFCGQFASGKPYFLSEDGLCFLENDRFFTQEELECPPPTCIWEDSQGIWWIGTRNQGVWRYTPGNKDLESVELGGDGADKSIRSITGDRNGNIWVASRFDYTRIAPDGGILVLKGGKSANNTNSMAVTDNGSPVIGSTHRLTWFPSGNLYNSLSIPLDLDGIIVNGETILSEIQNPLILGHETRQLAFSFSGKNFDPALQLQYQYKLDGYDRDWVYAGQVLRAGYSSLHPGRFTFRARVQLPDGTWSPDELRIPLRIKPSPWFSLPAMLLYLALLLGLIAFGIRQFVHLQVNREKLEISEQEKQLVEQISQERSTFFTNVSHEFRTPLSLIYGPVRELQGSPTLSDKDRDLVKLIERNSKRMLRLTDQLLHFNQSSANRDSLSIMQTDLIVVLRRMMKNFDYMFQQKGLRIQTHFPSELIVYCDREKVERIVFNLLSNAVKYTPEHGEITVTASTQDTRAYIEVADTGIGISPDKTERIFERYERLGEQVGDTLPSGFGIGLNYARHLATVHKGDLSVKANDPIGSVFTFAFPFRKEDYASEAIWQEEENTEEPPVLEDQGVGEEKGSVVLVVEDNHDMREYIRGFLKEKYKVIMAGDGEEAWKVIRINAPDLIVSDVMMPYKDGYTLCKELKNDTDYCHIPIILLTAKAEMEDQLHGLDLGADGYLGKPFDPAYLTALVRNLLVGRKRLQGLLADRTSNSPEPVEENTLSAQDKAFLDKCYRIIDEHIAEEDFGVTVLSMEMGMSRTSIFSKLKALVGQSPQTFLTNYRLNRAMELLKTHEWNISEVAYKVGFGTLTGFSRSFKNKFGVPPSSI